MDTPIGIALGFLLGAILIIGLVYLAARRIGRMNAPLTAEPHPSSAVPDINALDAAYFIARPAPVKVEYANDRARQLFGINGDAPNLERLARLAQPSDAFFDLFVTEGQATLTIANRLLEATSVAVPTGDTKKFVVILRENTQLTGLRVDDRSAQAITALAEVGRALSASLDLETTLRAVLQTVGRIVHYDFGEINLWESETQQLRPRARNGERSTLILIDQRINSYRLDEGYTGWIARHQQSLIINNVAEFTEAKPKMAAEEFPFKSVVGVPLLYGKEGDLVGVLEFSSFHPNAYTEHDLSLLETVAGQAAIAIRNAQRYGQQETRIAELSGLAQVAQTATTLADPHELFAGLVDRIAKLLAVQFCGFLLYDERERALVSQPPFRGVPEAFREHYRIPTPPDSQAARLWRESSAWYTDDMRTDPRVEAFGLKALAETLGMGASLLVPLIVSGNRLGIVQVANKLNKAPFNEEDSRLLRTLAGQAAVLIDNARLVREAEKRVRRSDALRQISEITGSAQSLEQIHQQVMQHIAQLLEADFGVVLLLDEAKGELAPQPGSEYGISNLEAESVPVHLRGDDPDFKFSATHTRRPFYTWRASRDRRILPAHRRLVEYFKIESIICAPLVIGDRGIGEMWLGGRQERRFTRADVPLVATVAAQLASAIERTRLASNTDETLRRRVEQLTALTRVGRELNQTLELEHVLKLVYDESIRATRADCGSILLLDIEANTPTGRIRLGAHSGDQTLNVIEYDVALSGGSYLIPDITAPRAFVSAQAAPPNLAAPGHDDIHSLLVAPIAYQGLTVGVIELHSRRVNAFDRAMLDFSQAIAAQAAIAVGNAQRYEEQIQRGELLRRRADQLSQLLQISRSVRSDRPLAVNLESIAYGIQEAVGFNTVLISVLDPVTGLLHHTSAAGLLILEFEQLKQNPGQLEQITSVLQPEFRISQSYYAPHNRLPASLRPAAAETAPAASPEPGPGEWHENDLLFVPLLGSGGQTVGMMKVGEPRSSLVPDLSTIETLEIFANQAALAIENARLYQSAESRAAELSHSLAELQNSYRDLDAVSRTLSRKEQELSNLIEQTELRARRLLGLHRIASATAEARTEDSLLQRTCRAAVLELGVDVCIVALLRDQTILQIIAQASVSGLEVDLNAYLGLHNPLSHIISIRSPLLARDLHGWVDSKLVQSLQLRSFVGVPIYAANQLNGALLVGNQLAEHAPFTNEDIDLLTILSGQLGAGLENIRLYTEVQQRLAENTGLFSETRELQEFSSSVLESLQQGLIVLDTKSNILRFNSWLRQTFGWTDALLGQNLFEFRPRYRDEGLADAITAAIAYNYPMQRIAIHESAPDGSLIVSRFYGYPLRREDKVTGVVLLVEDVTEQTRLEADVRERAIQLQALTEASRFMSSALHEADVVGLVLDQASRVIPYDSATLWLRDGDFLRVVGARGFEDDAQQLGLVVHVADSRLFKEMSESGRPILVPDVRNDPRFPAGIVSRTQSWLGSPLLGKDTSLGLLALDKVEANFYTAHHADLTLAFANQVAVALDNAHLFEESVQRAQQLNERSQRLALLNRVSGELNTTLDIDKIIEIAAREMSSAMIKSQVTVTLYDENMKESRMVAEYPAPTTASISAALSLNDDPITSRLLETKAPIVIEDVALSELLLPAQRLQFVNQGVKAKLIIPLLASGNLLGGVAIDRKEEQGRFRIGEIELAQTIGNQTAIAIQNARLFHETQRLLVETHQRRTDLATLYNLGVNASQMLEQAKLVDITLEYVQRLLQVDTAALVRVTESRALLAEAVEDGKRLEPFSIPLTGNSFSEYVINSGQPLLVRDATTEKLPVAGYMSGDRPRSWLGVPMLVRGATTGAILVQSQAANAFDETHLRLLSQVANQVTIAFENARLFTAAQNYAAGLEQRVAERTAALEKERDRVETLLRITSELSASLDLDRVLTRALSLVNDVIGGDSGGLYLVDAQSDTLIHRAALGVPFQLPPGGQPAQFRRGEGLVGWVIRNQEPVIVDDLTQDERWIRGPIDDESYRSAICVPLLSSEDCLGAMIFFSRIASVFSEDQLRLVAAAANQVTSAINNAELYRLIRDQAERLGGMLRANQVEASKNRAILESVADGVLVSDPNGKITLFNATAERILHLDRDEILNRPVRDFMGLYGARATMLVDTIEKWSNDPSSYRPGEYIAEQLTLDDKRIVSVLLAPVTTIDEFLGTVSIFRDITREVEVDRLKTEFVTTVSHELRTPITPIKGYADILLLGMAGPLAPDQKRAIELIKTNADRLKILVDDLLDISKIESGKVELRFELLPMEELVAEVASHLKSRSAAQDKPMTVLTEVPPSLPSVLGDRRRIMQVLMNLADNAFNYTHAEGTITISAARDEETLLLGVKDTGIGLAPEDQIRVFDRFYRVENPLVMASAGTGLGLSIVKRLVDMHGGRIWVESEGLGYGCTFFVRLKLAPKLEPEPAMVTVGADD